MLGKELVCHLADLSQGQHRRGQWVMGDRAIDRYRIACQRTFDRKLLNAAGEPRQQSTLRRERAYMDGMKPTSIHQDGHLHTGAFGQVCNEMRVPNVSIEFEHIAASERVDDVGGVLMLTLQILRAQRPDETFLHLVFPG